MKLYSFFCILLVLLCIIVYMLVCFLWKVNYTPVHALGLCTVCTAYRESRSIDLLFLDHGTRRGWGVRFTPRPLFTPGERAGTHFTGGWVGPRTGLEGQKISPPPRFHPRTVQLVASHYTDWATWPTIFCMLLFNFVYYVLLSLCMFLSRCCVSLCCSVYCFCVYIHCTTATGCQPSCSYQIYHVSYISSIDNIRANSDPGHIRF